MILLLRLLTLLVLKTSAVAKEVYGRYVEGTAVVVRQLRSVREEVTRLHEGEWKRREEQLRREWYIMSEAEVDCFRTVYLAVDAP
jgi:hypothetical protein